MSGTPLFTIEHKRRQTPRQMLRLVLRQMHKKCYPYIWACPGARRYSASERQYLERANFSPNKSVDRLARSCQNNVSYGAGVPVEAPGPVFRCPRVSEYKFAILASVLSSAWAYRYVPRSFNAVVYVPWFTYCGREQSEKRRSSTLS
jgi:hypothetical protein